MEIKEFVRNGEKYLMIDGVVITPAHLDFLRGIQNYENLNDMTKTISDGVCRIGQLILEGSSAEKSLAASAVAISELCYTKKKLDDLALPLQARLYLDELSHAK